MSYLFYSLYILYTRVFREPDFTVYITGLFALAEISIIDSVVIWIHGEDAYNPYVSTLIGFIFYYFNYRYFSARKKGIIEKYDSIHSLIKLLMVFVSCFLIGFAVWLWLANGLKKIFGPYPF